MKLTVIVCCVVAIFLGGYWAPFFFRGVPVKYQRSTGPDFVVLDCDNTYARLGIPRGKLDRPLEFYATEDWGEEAGRLGSSGEYLLLGNYSGLKEADSPTGPYAVVKIDRILPMGVYRLLGVVFLMVVAVSLGGIFWLGQGSK